MRPRPATVPNEFLSEGQERPSGWLNRVRDVVGFLASSRGLLEELTAHVDRIREHLVDSDGSIGDMARRVESYRGDLDDLTIKLTQAARGHDQADVHTFIAATHNLSRVSQLISLLTERQLLAVTSEKLDRACSDLERASELLEREHAKYQDALDHSAEATLITDGIAQIDDANEAVAVLLAIDAPRMTGRRLGSFVAQCDGARFDDFVRSMTASSSCESRSLRVRLQPNRSAPFDANLAVHAIRSESLGVIGYSWVITPVEPRSVPRALEP